MPSFPTFANGNRLFWPCVTRRTWKNLHCDNRVGFRFSYNERSSAPLMEWEVAGAIISDEDIEDLQAFFASMSGPYEDFDFLDEDTSTTYSKCRFINDELSVRHAGPNENEVSFAIRELV